MAENPRKGGSRKKRSEQDTAFSIVLDQPVIVSLGGKRRPRHAGVALQLKTFEEALAGGVSAVRTVLGWIEERDAARARGGTSVPKVRVEFGTDAQDPGRMEDALLLLGISIEDTTKDIRGKRFLRLKPWAIQAALDRREDWQLSNGDWSRLQEHVEQPDDVTWPIGVRDGR